ncbi:aminotransferase class I/II-fold pyridoxal phosphate-dependent enzyme [Klebsiella pneumoniae]|nr:aminotransferase class I/II-fold pyridoxal phosphate-dependent enzyme [Klebsiella pneumoniae]
MALRYMDRLEAALARTKNTLLLLCSRTTQRGKSGVARSWRPWRPCVKNMASRVISDEIHMDMTWGRTPPYPVEQVAQGPWAFTSGSKSFNIPAFTGAYGFIPEENERDSYLQALKGRDGLSSPFRAGAGRPCRRLPRRGSWLDALRDYLQANMRYVTDTLNNAFPRARLAAAGITYLAWIDLRPLNVDDRALQQALIADKKWRLCGLYLWS